MKVCTLLAASLTLAFAAGAYAQDNTSTASNAPTDAASTAPASKAVSKPHHHAMKHHAHHHGHVPGDPAVIDRSDDHLIVTPTETKITIPVK